MHSPPQTHSSQVSCRRRFRCLLRTLDVQYIVQCIKYIVQNLTNFSELISHILIMPSLEPDTAVLSNRSCIRSQGRFLISSVRSSFSSQELFTLQCSITGFYSATPQCTAVSPQSFKVASVSLQMKGALVQLMQQQKKCNSYDKTERTTTQWVVPTSLDILFIQVGSLPNS